MRDLAEIARFLESQEPWSTLLRHVESLALPDGWIGAGFVRNAVWDVLHGREPDLATSADVDVIFFDPNDLSQTSEQNIETRLRVLDSAVPWSVRNQARMHLKNGDAPYRDSEDAVRCWPETATAVAARRRDECVEMIAPHGVDDLLGLIVRPTPAFAGKRDIYRARVAAKNWTSRWPQLGIYSALAIH